MPQKANIVGGGTVPSAVPNAELVIDPGRGAARASLNPDDHLVGGQTLGHYRVSATTGLMTTLAAGVLIYSWRYADPATIALIKRISAYAAVTTTFTAGQIIDCDAITVRQWTVNDSAGTAIAIGAGGKMRGNMGASRLSVGNPTGDIRVATAAAITAGGTKTPDPNPFGYAAIGASTAADVGSGGFMGDLYKLDATNQHPLIYAANEGFNCRVGTTQGAAGVVKITFVVEWAELLGF